MLRNNLDDILKNILLSHIVVKELPANNSNKTLIRIHLIPISGSSNAQHSVFYPKHFVKQKRNLHLSHLPKYRKIKEDMLDTSFSKELSSESCSICYSQFKQGEYFRKLPICKHVYHKKCIDKWFAKDKEQMKCPICRTSHNREKVEDFTRQNQSLQNVEVK